MRIGQRVCHRVGVPDSEGRSHVLCEGLGTIAAVEHFDRVAMELVRHVLMPFDLNISDHFRSRILGDQLTNVELPDTFSFSLALRA